jgi:uncharacterized protein YodC (DUF2158 family)
MATQFKKGDAVQLNSVTPSGPVEKIRMAEDGSIHYLISWTDKNDHLQTRWFEESELIAVE